MNETPPASQPALLMEIYRQNWENARHVKTERISFMNAYSLISAGVLTLLQQLPAGDLIGIVLLFFMTLFSVFGFLTSLRLKGELEECLTRIRSITTEAQMGQCVALGELEGRQSRFPKFRWLFPVFYAMTTMGFVILILYRLVTGHLAIG